MYSEQLKEVNLLYKVLQSHKIYDIQIYYTKAGNLIAKDDSNKWKNKEFYDDARPLVEGCDCYACQNHSRAYIRHLWRCGESTASTLLSIHNIQFLVEFSQKCREAILQDRFGDFYNEHYQNLIG